MTLTRATVRMATDDHHAITGRWKALVLATVGVVGLIGLLGVALGVVTGHGTPGTTPSRIGGRSACNRPPAGPSIPPTS